MPFYEYICDNDTGCDCCIQVFVVSQSMADDVLECCPQCKSRIKRLISRLGGIVMKNREANQYGDIQQAKFWRDKNGVRHPVTPADGDSKASTVSQQVVSPEEAKARTKVAKAFNKKQKDKASYRKYVKNVFKNKVQ